MSAPAYHTLTGCTSEHGHEMTGPPREVYLNDPTEVTEDEQLTRVEWPINAEFTARHWSADDLRRSLVG